MQVQFKTTSNHHDKIMSAKSGRSSSTDTRKRQMNWQPQSSSLTRDETRELVLDMIG